MSYSAAVAKMHAIRGLRADTVPQGTAQYGKPLVEQARRICLYLPRGQQRDFIMRMAAILSSEKRRLWASELYGYDCGPLRKILARAAERRNIMIVHRAKRFYPHMERDKIVSFLSPIRAGLSIDGIWVAAELPQSEEGIHKATLPDFKRVRHPLARICEFIYERADW